jgi:putative acyl-CoA dehydrogenase
MEHTHEVLNQPPPLEGYSLYETDAALREGLAREGGAGFETEVEAAGRALGSAETFAAGRLANRFTPELRTHDRFGHRIDEVEYHPAWHDVMRLAMSHHVHNLPWCHVQPGGQVARAALLSMLAQVEAGACCPLTMTFAAWRCSGTTRRSPRRGARACAARPTSRASCPRARSRPCWSAWP